MSEEVRIEFIEGPTTPAQYRDKVGTFTFPFEPTGPYAMLPAPGTKGQLMGVPGIMREGLKWEIAEVDLRSEVEKLLDQADELLKSEVMAGELPGVVQRRHLEAQYLLLKAQSKILRGMAR